MRKKFQRKNSFKEKKRLSIEFISIIIELQVLTMEILFILLFTI